jgi:ribosomal-protein-alanine N-acetyltransferase
MEPAYVRPAQAEEKVRLKLAGFAPPTIRTLGAPDLPAVEEMEHRLFSDPWPQHFFLTALTEPAAVLRVAERAGSVVGYYVATLQPPYAELQNLATAPDQQRSGVARALMAEFFDTCRARGVREVGLEVRASNAAAQALYRGLGFRLMGLRRGYYKSPDEDALLMGKRLD